MAKRIISPNPFISVQRERVRKFLKLGRGKGDHLKYLGYIIPENEALLDAFHYFNDKDKDCKTGYPIVVLVDVTGDDIRYANPDEVFFCLSGKLPKREPMDEDCKL